MPAFLILEILLAIAGPVVWLGWYKRDHTVRPIEFGMILWVLYGASVALIVFLHILHLGDPFRGFVLAFALFGPQLFLVAAVCRLAYLTIKRSLGGAASDVNRRFDITGASVVTVAAVLHHLAFMNGPWP